MAEQMTIGQITVSAAAPPARVSYWGAAWRRFRQNKLGIIGLGMVALLIVLAVFGPFLAPHSYATPDYGATYAPPSGKYWLGTDELGRDLFSRLLWSLRNAVMIAFGAEAITLVVGFTIGALAALQRGWVDSVLMRITDIMFAFPSYLFSIILVAVMGRGLLTIFLAIGIASWPGMARLVRSQVLMIRDREYMEAARLAGASTPDLLLRYIFPNSLGPIIVALTFGVPGAMMVEAGLALIGLGVMPPMPSFGNMINDGVRYIFSAVHLALFPSLFFAITLLSFQFLGDALRDAFDPRSA